MPAYDFKCPHCSRVIEVVRPATDDSAVICTDCGLEMKQRFHPIGVHFHGSGFHNTDNRKAGPPASSDNGACDAAGTSPACGGCPAAE
jgi:putative FmdB family regulatory protein